MKKRRNLLQACTLGLAGLVVSTTVCGEEMEPRSVEELFERSAAAYRALPAVEIVMTSTADIPVIFLTAKAQKQEVESYLALGATGVILKPFDVMTFAEDIRRIVDGG